MAAKNILFLLFLCEGAVFLVYITDVTAAVTDKTAVCVTNATETKAMTSSRYPSFLVVCVVPTSMALKYGVWTRGPHTAPHINVHSHHRGALARADSSRQPRYEGLIQYETCTLGWYRQGCMRVMPVCVVFSARFSSYNAIHTGNESQ